MKKFALFISIVVSSLSVLASDFNQSAIALAQSQDHAQIYRVSQKAPQLGQLYSTYSSRVDWSQGYTSVFIGKRKNGVPAASYGQKITHHIDVVTKTFTPAGLRGYLFIVYGDYEIAFQNWTSEKAPQDAFATLEGKAIAADAGSFMDPSLFAVSKDFEWLNRVSYPSSLSEPGQCSNFAKAAAIRAYMGSVPGVERDNLTYKADLMRVLGDQEKYSVLVESPCVAEGDDSNCSMEYEVVTTAKGGRCSVSSIKETE